MKCRRWHRLQPDDRPARGADRRPARRQHPARHAPRLHRGGAVERHRRRHRGRCDAPASGCSTARPRRCSRRARQELEGKKLAPVSPELDEFMRGEQSEANVLLAADGGQRTLAVKRVRYADGSVLTFDDITEQLLDQRRAAWSDIARRIAHEIKNPLTPIQLAAERLQRRFGKEISVRPGDVRAADRRRSSARSAICGAWSTNSPTSRACPSPCSATRTFTRSRARPCSCTRSRIPAIAFALEPPDGAVPHGLRPPAARPGADQRRQEWRRGD